MRYNAYREGAYNYFSPLSLYQIIFVLNMCDKMCDKGFRISHIAYRISHIAYRISHIAYRISHIAYRISQMDILKSPTS